MTRDACEVTQSDASAAAGVRQCGCAARSAGARAHTGVSFGSASLRPRTSSLRSPVSSPQSISPPSAIARRAMTAHAFLAAICVHFRNRSSQKKTRPEGKWKGGNSSVCMHRIDSVGNQKTALPVGMALSARSEGGHPLLALATTPPGRRLFLSSPAPSGASMTYSCSIGSTFKGVGLTADFIAICAALLHIL